MNKETRKELLKIFQIKKMIALLTTIVFCVLSIMNKISSSEFLSVFSMIVAFYFGQSSVRQTYKEK